MTRERKKKDTQDVGKLDMSPAVAANAATTRDAVGKKHP
jgi:hypothetical protein